MALRIFCRVGKFTKVLHTVKQTLDLFVFHLFTDHQYFDSKKKCEIVHDFVIWNWFNTMVFEISLLWSAMVIKTLIFGNLVNS
jgi:hypothetical protein